MIIMVNCFFLWNQLKRLELMRRFWIIAYEDKNTKYNRKSKPEPLSLKTNMLTTFYKSFISPKKKIYWRFSLIDITRLFYPKSSNTASSWLTDSHTKTSFFVFFCLWPKFTGKILDNRFEHPVGGGLESSEIFVRSKG